MARTVIPLSQGFFNDGFYYVLTSGDLGGSGTSTANMEEKLQDPGEIKALLEAGVCLPLYFDGDCAMDRAVVVIGELSEVEQAEWVGRVRSWLTIPDGRFVFMGGGIQDAFDEALSGEEPDPDEAQYQVVSVEPGRYLVEVYAFVGSLTVNELWGSDCSVEDEAAQMARPREVGAHWEATRPDEAKPAWLTELLETGHVGESESEPWLEYVVRLVQSDEAVPVPEQEADTGWCGVFEVRQPELTPRGILRASVGPQREGY